MKALKCANGIEKSIFSLYAMGGIGSKSALPDDPTFNNQPMTSTRKQKKKSVLNSVSLLALTFATLTAKNIVWAMCLSACMGKASSLPTMTTQASLI